MKNLLLIASLALPLVVASCTHKEEQPKDLYVAGVYTENEKVTETDTYAIKDNELFALVRDGFNNINLRYGGIIAATDDTEVLAAYDQVLVELKALKASSDNALASGKDFGASAFSVDSYCRAYKGVTEIKSSECFKFEYRPNTRIISPTEIKINTEFSSSVNGETPVLLSDTKLNLKILGWKLYEADGDPTVSNLITKVELDAGEETFFDVYFQAEKGVSAGDFYLLVTFEDEAKDVFDYLIKVTHKTA